MSATSEHPEGSRKERREQARAERHAAEAAAAAASARRRRLMQLGGVAVAVIVIAAIVIAVSSGGSSKQGIATGTQANQPVNTVTSELSGIPQSANILGNPNAGVTVQYFGDLQCPVCAQFTVGTMAQMINTYVKPGTVKVEYRSLQTATPDANVFHEEQAAALAAGRQSKMWDYVELFYRQQGPEGSGYVTQNFLQQIARQVPGLDFNKWNTDRFDPKLRAEVSADEQVAAKAGLNSTPTLIVIGPRGNKGLVGAVSLSNVAGAISSVR